jgi:hypothetical protein
LVSYRTECFVLPARWNALSIIMKGSQQLHDFWRPPALLTKQRNQMALQLKPISKIELLWYLQCITGVKIARYGRQGYHMENPDDAPQTRNKRKQKT